MARKSLLISCFTFLTLLLLNNKVSAGNTTAYGVVTVQITIASSCTVAASNLSFGNYSYDAVSANTSLNVTCTNTTPYQIGLSAGTGRGATVATRKMTLGGNTLDYSLYQDAARTVVWGNTRGVDTFSGTGTGLQRSITVYGQIPASQLVNTGSYTDVITATIYF